LIPSLSGEEREVTVGIGMGMEIFLDYCLAAFQVTIAAQEEQL